MAASLVYSKQVSRQGGFRRLSLYLWAGVPHNLNCIIHFGVPASLRGGARPFCLSLYGGEVFCVALGVP